MDSIAKEGSTFDAKQAMVSYTLDVIAMAGIGTSSQPFISYHFLFILCFILIGIQSNSFANPDSPLRKNVNKCVRTNPLDFYLDILLYFR